MPTETFSLAAPLFSGCPKDMEEKDYVRSELLVKFKDSVSDRRGREIIKEQGAVIIRYISEIKVYHLSLKEGQSVIDAAGLTIYPDGLSIGRGHLEPQEKYNQIEEVFVGSGCASLFRKEMLEEIGFLDEDFFAYAEDTDLGWRARLAGWKAYYVPEAIVYHHHSKKFGTYSTLKAFLVERNRIWVAWKNFPYPVLCLWPFYTLLRYFYQGVGMLIRRGASGKFGQESSSLLLIPIILKAFLSGFRGLPTILKKRKEVQNKKRISNWEVFSLFKKYGIKAREIAFKE